MSTPGMPDPRVERTRSFVLDEVRKMLSENQPVNFSEVSRRARVSRRTLYTHWGTVEAMVSDSISHIGVIEGEPPAGASTEERAYAFLSDLVGQVNDGTAVAVAAMLTTAGRDPGSAQAFERIQIDVRSSFEQRVGTPTDNQLLEILSPIVVAKLAGAGVDDDLLRSLARRTAEFLDSSE